MQPIGPKPLVQHADVHFYTAVELDAGFSPGVLGNLDLAHSKVSGDLVHHPRGVLVYDLEAHLLAASLSGPQQKGGAVSDLPRWLSFLVYMCRSGIGGHASVSSKDILGPHFCRAVARVCSG